MQNTDSIQTSAQETLHRRCLPDKRLCRTRAIGKILTVADCLTDQSGDCIYACHWGASSLCRNPEWQKYA
ncbi:MAG: hypothetical protein WCH43_03755 [Verrucomicrobiota bacterium]